MYIKLDTLEYPLTPYQVRAHFPNTSFPDAYADFDGFALVMPTTAPEYDPMTQACTEAAPEEVNGVWTQRWAVTSLSSSDAAARLTNLRTQLANEVDALVFKVYEKPNILAREYLAREAQAQAYKNAGYSGTPGPYFQGFITESGLDATTACDLILTQASNFRAAEPELANLRMVKYSILRAATAAEARSLHAATINRIKEIAVTL